MTKKDYIAIADAIKRARTGADKEERFAIDIVADNIADVFQKDNPRFNRQRFLEACQN